jgi:hypothetical protein
MAWKLCASVFKEKIKNEEIWELAVRIKKKIGSYEECKNLGERAVM